MSLGYDSYEEALEARREWERRSKPLKRNSRLDRQTPLSPVSDKRDEERERAYGPEERRRFVTSLPCEACGKRGEDIHQAHIESGGMGRKADADKVVPLCFDHHRQLDDVLGSVESFDREFDTDLRAAAERVGGEWQRIQSEEADRD